MKTLLTERVYSLALTIGMLVLAASLLFPAHFPTFENFSQVIAQPLH